MAAGVFYGATWLKGARYGGKAAVNAYKFTRGAYTASRTTKKVMEARNVVKLAQETKPLLQRITQSAERSLHGLGKGGNVPRIGGSPKSIPDGHIWHSGSPFKNKSAEELHHMFKEKGYDIVGSDPLTGKGSYINPSNYRQYRIDPCNVGRYREPNHVDVFRVNDYKGNLPKKRFKYLDD